MATNKRLIKSNDEGGGVSFNTVLYTGNGGTNPITDVGFQPDLVWAKGRSVPYSNVLTDSVRGAGAHSLFSDLTIAEDTSTSYLSSFNTDGFTLTSQNGLNQNGATYVAWCWKAGGAAVTNTDGTITSQVSANTEAGFSIVSYTTPTGGAATAGHGLGTTPQIIIQKRRNGTSDWYFSTTLIDGSYDYLLLNSTAAKGDQSGQSIPTSTIFDVLNFGTLGEQWIAYCFAEVAGFSKFGSYSGGSTGSGAEISVGFEPAFVMIKKTDGVSGLAHWWIWDNKRNPSSPYGLQPDLSNAEATDDLIRFTSTGFYFVSTSGEINNSGSNFIYMAFANQF